MTPVKTDEDVKIDIIASLQRDARVDASNVAVNVDERMVTLSGTVSSYRSMWAAYDDALLTDGVVRVFNLMSIKPERISGAPTDADIAENARKLLSWSTDVDATTVSIAVERGTLTLTGTVTSYSESEAVEEAVSFLGGVAEVKNELAVVPNKRLSDEMIAADIISELGRSILLDAANLHVKVVEGVVTLSGDVSTTFSSARAERIAKNAWGVKDVNNLTKVKFI